MDVTEKIKLVKREPTEEVVTEEELLNLFNTNSQPKHYIGLEISGFMHLGSLILTGFKINDFIKAGVKCTVFLADWHTYLNNKLDGDWDKIRMVSKYYADAFKMFCPGVEIVEGSQLYESRRGYWLDLVKFSKNMSLERTMRSMTIMGRSAEKDKIDLGQLFYPPMQAVDIHTMDLDIVHAGMDQRKIHMLVREIFPKMKWKVPVAVHHHILAGLGEPEPTSNSDSDFVPSKMSKSKSASGIFVHDTDEEINSKFKKAWCPEGIVDKNPVLEISKHIIFHEFNEVIVERPAKFGGNVTYTNYQDLEVDFAQKKLHPSDLKATVSKYVTNIIRPIREKIVLTEELSEAIKKTT
ncbi:MAG: tyrosine--tRNA ligase [Thaumarchaeota archaeon]|nr:tyrosine--tRNA ligase [Nitrososphaerota archaeon]MDE1832275.1 tyrosine--tRNA ligase [Nitrososphaerota archaeon]MDE1878602.1 tyrosine--tRNA ligase [Nitrososphaerota archaeon]